MSPPLSTDRVLSTLNQDGKYTDADGNPTFDQGPDKKWDWQTYSGYIRYNANCIVCHGPDGSGQIGPNLTDLFQLHGTTRMDLYGTIVGGAPGTAMIAWGEVMKPAELLAVATFVTTLRGKNLPGKAAQGVPVAAFAH